MPPNAIPGDHVGGIEALDVTPPATGGSNRVLVHEGIGVPIFIKVPGPRHPVLPRSPLVNTASSVPWLAFATGSSDARVGYQVQNTGNTILRGKVHVSVTNIFGQTVKTFPSNVMATCSPAQTPSYPEPLWKSCRSWAPDGARDVQPGRLEGRHGIGHLLGHPVALMILILIVLLPWVTGCGGATERSRRSGSAREGTGVSGSAAKRCSPRSRSHGMRRWRDAGRLPWSSA